MANLSTTSLCNRTCAYCFTGAAFKNQPPASTHMPLTTFGQALDFLDRSHMDEVRLLGGEPTLHPEFCQLVDQAMEREFRLLVFSNGLMPERAFLRVEEVSADRLSVLINVTDLMTSTSEANERQITVFRRLGARVILGFNIYKPVLELDFMLDLIDEFGLSRTIRLGLAHPCVSEKNEFLHAQYYAKAGQSVAAFAKRANGVGVALDFDCGFVPCMFSDDSMEALGGSAAEIGVRCNPILDILPNGRVVSCYPLAGVYSVPLPFDLDASRLRAQFQEKMSHYRTLGVFRECSVCALRKTGECVGGCLAAAMRRLRHGSSEFAVHFKGLTETSPKRHRLSVKCEDVEPAQNEKKPYAASNKKKWLLPYVDQPISFWDRVSEEFGQIRKEIYFPLPTEKIGSGRPEQPTEHLDDFLRHDAFNHSALLNPMTLSRPVKELGPKIIETLRRFMGEYGLTGVTVSNLTLAAFVRESFPELPVTASCLMDIATPSQVLMLDGICDTLVPSSRIMRNLPALKALREAFSGHIRLLVNEACMPGCPFRVQHFYEMGSNVNQPRSLCEELLRRHPWMRITGTWVLPQHLHLYDGVFDELKIAGRVTLRNSEDYLRVLKAYVNGEPLMPNEIGGGPASVLDPLPIEEAFYSQTLTCKQQCHRCTLCRDYYQQAMSALT